MALGPSTFDIWFVRQLVHLLGRFPLLDLAVESAIRHGVLGGLLFAATVFLFWMQAARSGQRNVRWRLLTTLLASILAVAMSLLVAQLIAWLPPSRNPEISNLYPSYLEEKLSNNSFPSQSTALYASVAAGIFSVNRIGGSVLWIGVCLLVGLPRIYVGGHYPTDVLAGALIGLAAYWISRGFFEPNLVLWLDQILEHRFRAWGEVIVFVWILQLAVEFRELVWLKNCIARFWK